MSSDSSEASGATIGISAAIGGLGAVIVDLIQKGDASAISKLTGTVNNYGHLLSAGWPDVPIIVVGLALVALAIGLAFLSEAKSRNTAFYSGASVVSVLMTLIPYDAPLPLPSGATVNRVTLEDSRPSLESAALIPAVYRPEYERPIIRVAAGQLPVTVIVHLPRKPDQNAIAPRVDGRLFDSVSGKIWQIGYSDTSANSKSSEKEIVYRFDFTIETGETRGGTIADLKLRIAAQGYSAAWAQLRVTTPGAPAVIEVTLQQSLLPRGFEGLGRIFDRPNF